MGITGFNENGTLVPVCSRESDRKW